MPGVQFEIKLGSWTVSSDPQKSSAPLLQLSCELAMGGAGGHCVVELGAAALSPPVAGDPVTVSLDAGQGATQVFTGHVQEVVVGTSLLRISAGDGLALLARTYIESAYEQVTAGFLAKELLGKAGLTPGKIDDGPTFPSYVLHKSPRALAHLHRLAELCGVEVFVDGEGKVHFRAPKEGAADHTFLYREHVLDLDLCAQPPTQAGVTLFGEGAASKQGAAKAHVLQTDLASVKGQAGPADKSLLMIDGAVRTGDDADKLAAARLHLIKSRPVRGFLTVLPSPQIKLGEHVRIDELPKTHKAAATITGGKVLRARSVRHTLSLHASSAHQGFITRIGF